MKTSSKNAAIFSAMVIAALMLLTVAVFVGPASITFDQVIESLTRGSGQSVDTVVNHIRIPRIILSFLLGAALAVSGVVFQGLLANPLAGPFTIGISSGAAFGAIISIFFGFSVWMLPFSAIGGALFTLMLVFVLSFGREGMLPQNLILAGIVVSSIFSAAISLIKSLSGESLSSIVFWIMGSISGRGWSDVMIFIPYFVVAFTGLMVFARDLDMLSLGDDHAHSLGVDVKNCRKVLIFFASILAASAVAVSGVIGFVGLVIPHLMRFIVGPSHRRLLLFSALGGGILLLGADTLARLIAVKYEIPVGVITSLIGGPFFCYLLIHRRTFGKAGEL